jgi:ribonuclease HI
MKEITIYTDGGADPNPGLGGWACVLLFGAHRKELSGAEPDTTNNRMELRAVIEALRALNEPCEVSLFVDSEYVKKGLTLWLANWKRNGWRTASKEPVKNKELWLELEAQCAKHSLSWQWVKGHAGNRENERCDQLVHQARVAFRSSRS